MPAGTISTRSANTKSTKTSGSEKSPKPAGNSPQSPSIPVQHVAAQDDKWLIIRTQLNDIKSELCKTVKIEDIRDIIKEITGELFRKYQEKIEKKIEEKLESLKQQNEKLKFSLKELHRENQALKKENEENNQILKDLNNRVDTNEKLTQLAISKSNKHEQYSWKNNIKFLGFPESNGENPLEIINAALSEVGINLEQDNIAEIHRIPGQRDQPKPILVKMRNAKEKTKIYQ